MSGVLHPGSAISHYRVISSLGSGGMGEVYMARDETLERAVALKVLPSELTMNQERVRRFIQEAKSASSLSHPNIVTIYEIGHAEPRSTDSAADEGSAPLHFIAMELITGETLKHKIYQEKTPLRSLVMYLAQAAEGLAKAHSAGIVHRDLKPENIMVNRDGYAKVLDFGLAKLVEQEAAAEDLSSALTSGPTRDQTREGAIVGTVGYMSPEQVRGKAADHRSDIFSFGCILYEAATGQKPFPAGSSVEIMHRILHDNPVPVEEVNAEVPAVLRRVLRRCMAKSPEQRFQSMKDLALELGEIAAEYDQLPTTSGEAHSASGVVRPALADGKRRRTVPGLWMAAAIVVGLTGAWLGIYGLRQRAAAPAGTAAPFQNMRMEPLTTRGNVETAALSPDGRYLANVVKEAGSYSLWVRQVATESDVQIVPPLPTPFRGVSFSPDEDYVYYVNQQTGGPGYSVLYQVPVLGGTARKILFDVDTAVTFSPDGKRFALIRGYPTSGESALIVANADGSEEKQLAVLKKPAEFAFVSPSWSPDGKRIAAAARTSAEAILLELVAVDPEDGELASFGGSRWFTMSALAWVRDGSGVVVTAADEKGGLFQQVWLVSYPGGETRRITNDLNQYQGISIAADSGTLATTQQNRVLNVWVASRADATGAKQVTFGSGKEDAITSVEAGPEDSVFFTAVQNNGIYVGVVDADGEGRTRLTPVPGLNLGPSLSRNGEVLVFQSLREDRIPHIWRMNLDGTNPVQVTRGAGERLEDVSPDGRWVIYASREDLGLYKISIDGGTPAKLADTNTEEARFSPDGRWIAYTAYLQDRGPLQRSLMVIPSEGGRPVHTFSHPDGFGLRWAPEGDALTYHREVAGVSNLWSQPLDGSDARQITDFKDGVISSYDWSADGKRIYLSRGSETRDVVLIRDFR